MLKRRKGFSLIELAIVVTMVGILATLGLPRFRMIRDRNNVNAARERIASTVAAARASAIHKGRLSQFAILGNQVMVHTQDPTNGAWQPQVVPVNINTIYPGVTLQIGGAGLSSIIYEPRGLTWSGAKPPSKLVFRIVGQTRKDSVCVSRQGQILPRGCAL